VLDWGGCRFKSYQDHDMIGKQTEGTPWTLKELINKAMRDIIVHDRSIKLLDEPPEVIVRHGENRMNFKYKVINIEYDVNNKRVVIVTGERVD
jgi:hypothetical protein